MIAWIKRVLGIGNRPVLVPQPRLGDGTASAEQFAKEDFVSPNRRDIVIGALACLTVSSTSAKSLTPKDLSDPYYSKFMPPEERVFWSAADKCYVWVSKPLGKDERIWRALSFTVTAGISETDPSIRQKGDRIRVFMVYESPEGISLNSIIGCMTHKSVYAKPRSDKYGLQSVNGMDAERRSRLYIASPGPFVVDSVLAGYRVTDAVVARYQEENPGAGSMPDPEAGMTVLFAGRGQLAVGS